MTTDPLLPSLPLLLETKPELFSTAELQNLQQTLASLENNPPENADQILRDWCKARRPIRDTLRNLADSNRELKQVPPSQASQSARITNIFQELSQKVKEKLSQRTDSSKSDSAQPDKNKNND